MGLAQSSKREEFVSADQSPGYVKNVRIPYPYLISGNNPYPFPYPYQTFQLVTYPYPSTYFFSKINPYPVPNSEPILENHPYPFPSPYPFFDFSYVPVPVPISVQFPYTSRTWDFWSRRDRGNLMRFSKNHLRILKNQPFDKKNCLRR